MPFRAAQLDTVFTADTRQVDAATRKVEGNLKRTEKVAVDSGKKTGGAFRSMGAFATSAGGMIASAGIGALLYKTSQDASALGEVTDFTTQVFKKNAAEMERWGGTTLDTMGAAKVTALDAANGFGVLFNAADLTGTEVVDLSQGMVQLAADMSSAKDVPLEESLTAIRSGLVGESEPLRRFGILLNETAVKEEAVRLGLVGTNEELSEAAKTRARVSLITKEGAIYNGNYADTADSMANKQRKASEAAKEASAEFGEALAPVMAKVFTLASNLAGAFGDLPEPIQNTALGLGGLLVFAGPLTKTIQGLSAAVVFLTTSSSAGAIALTGYEVVLGNVALAAGTALTAVKALSIYVGIPAVGLVLLKNEVDGTAEAVSRLNLSLSTMRGESHLTADAQKEMQGRIADHRAELASFQEMTEGLNLTNLESILLFKELPDALDLTTISQGRLEKAIFLAQTRVEAQDKSLAGLNLAFKANGSLVRRGQAQYDEFGQVVYDTGRTIDGTGRRIRRFAGMTERELGEWAAGTEESLNGVQGSLGDLAQKANLTTRRVLRTFRNQVDAAKDYAKDWTTVLDRGIAKKAPELTQSLQEMGLEGAGIVSALASANREDFGRIIQKWNEAERIAGRTAGGIGRAMQTTGTSTTSNLGRARDEIQRIADDWLELREIMGDPITGKVGVSGGAQGGPTVPGIFPSAGGSSFAMGNAAIAAFPGLMRTSGYRDGDPGFHGDPTNPANDLAMSGWPSDTSGIFSPQAYAVYRWVTGTFGAAIREAIYGSWIWEHGREGVYTGGDHWGHVHLAKDGLIATGPTLAMLAEAGGSEAAIPLGSGRGRRALAQAFQSALHTDRVPTDTKGLEQAIRSIARGERRYRPKPRDLKETITVKMDNQDLVRVKRKRKAMGYVDA